ncbi:hypothetical protein [Roseivirga sp. E12]|uniref:hypothetical protein n=1 Tax=Roseivirga sp. E12 TaxID=2819237 RepID=UPI001ABC61E6|nr:hypothetical protein [Roseivirga sp. E12]MBO3696925.1 hypothetical protein [Roseivirga sp. E12]
MKKLTLCLTLFCTLILTISSCNKSSKVEAYPTGYLYDVSVTLDTLNNAPALQSFVHGVDGNIWLLFAGRTNRLADDGGIHGIINGDYAAKSFLPLSFNEDIFAYDVVKDTVTGMSYGDMLDAVGKAQPLNIQLYAALRDFGTVFRNSNPLVTQDGEYLYVVGGYGTPLNDTNSSNAYNTFDHVARIHVPSMISLVSNKLSGVEWTKLFAAGSNASLKSTGAEIFKLDDTFYLAGGHDFGSKAPNGQKYLDAVYPFKMSQNAANPYQLDITVDSPISDMTVSQLATSYSDAHSKFRRRDGPVVPSLFKNSAGTLTEGLTFYSGVFRPDSLSIVNKDTTRWRLPWESAIYVHPSLSSSYTIDSNYKQARNVYACADFTLYDSETERVHTFLLGGIGDGQSAGNLQVSGFTNAAMQVQFDVNQNSSSWTLKDNVFDSDYFYGAESVFIQNNLTNIKSFSLSNGKTTELIDAEKTFVGDETLDLGYVYGGIEAFQANPGTFGPGNSAASNKIWRVTLSRKPREY